MKTKNNNRVQILLRILKKSDELMDGVIQLTAGIKDVQPGLLKHLNKTSMTSPYYASLVSNHLKEYLSEPAL